MISFLVWKIECPKCWWPGENSHTIPYLLPYRLKWECSIFLYHPKRTKSDSTIPQIQKNYPRDIRETNGFVAANEKKNFSPKNIEKNGRQVPRQCLECIARLNHPIFSLHVLFGEFKNLPQENIIKKEGSIFKYAISVKTHKKCIKKCQCVHRK